MLEKSLGILFYLKHPRNHYGNSIPVYLRITVDGVPSEISTKRKWDPLRWDARKGRASGTKDDAKALNTFIELLAHKVHEARRKLIDANKEVSAVAIKNLLFGVDESKYVIQIFQEHNQSIKALVPHEYSAGTLDLFERTLLHTQRFIQWKYGTDDININKLDYEFIERFAFWFKTVRKCQHNSTIKYLTYFKKIVLLCVKRKWLNHDPFAEFSLARRENIRPYLTETEITTIAKKAFPTDRLNVVRDIFLFSCYTGLAYADVQKLKRSEIIIGIDKQQWIDTTRQKTESATRIPLLPFPLSIIKKYETHPACQAKGTVLPIPSNQKMNAYLKEIADTCGINKTLTFHIARHTFATTVTLSNGVPIESVAKMLGHKNLKQTQHYAKVLDFKVGNDMQALKEKLTDLS
ncbi:site-specific integrase [Mucilaginibacter sp. RS28]|uniref:Site-specific integrase n=1 Tax=Mucilaginibacter straminoryzae TaxID=2932774 RepID=A0A9X2BF23_9SPHI|nr:site-specific integrase [Mucilaginibacter straminoryzae]MCJ8212058.1 site-specific integrase [Mucilaginibacter straminoryzae]